MRNDRKTKAELMEELLEARRQLRISTAEPGTEDGLRRELARLQEANGLLQRRVGEEVAANHAKELLLMRQNPQAVMGRMMGDIVHQWRQPLTKASLLIQDLAESYAAGNLTGESLDNTINLAMEEILRISRAIDEYRDFIRPDTTKVPFLVGEILDRTLSFIEPHLRYRRIELETHIPHDLRVEGYPHEYGQVLFNIIVNAKDALLQGKVESPKIAISGRLAGRRSVLSVTDNAGAMAGDHLERLFEPHPTPDGEEGGRGEGLYMARTVIERRMGGRLTARNSGDGVEFRIEV